jgi:glycosyltransferase 2 family protein
LDPAATPINSSGVDTAGKDVCRSRVKHALAYAFAVACLVWVFHDVHPRQLLASLFIANWGLVALAIIADILTYVLQALRWKLLLAPVGRLTTLRATQGIYAGLFTNELVPLHLGELVRAFLVSRWLSSRFTEVLPSMVIERFLDALWVAIGFAFAAIFVPLPKDLVRVGEAVGGIVLLAAGLFLWMVFRTKEVDSLIHDSTTLVHTWSLRFTSHLASGLRDIGISRRLYVAALLSGSMLVSQIVALWFMMLACRIDRPIGAAAAVLLVVRFGTAIPNAPANVGSFQFFTVLALGLFGEDKTIAAGFSLIYFFVLTVPLWILGLLAVSRTGISLSTIRLEAAALRSGSPGAANHPSIGGRFHTM